jgi:hypothetical protein
VILLRSAWDSSGGYVRALDATALPVIFPAEPVAHTVAHDAPGRPVFVLIGADGKPLCAYGDISRAFFDAGERGLSVVTIH